MHHLKLNFKGFTLTEVMVSVGVLGIIVLIASGSSQMILKSATTADKVSEQVTLTNEITSILSDPRACTAALAGQKSSDGNEVSLGLNIQSGQKYAGKIDIRELRLSNISKITETAYRADLILRGAKMGDVIGSKDFSKTFRAYYAINDKNQIESCLGESLDPAAHCSALGGEWGDLIKRCDFCKGLGGVWQGNKCQLPQEATAVANEACDPELYSQTTKSAVADAALDQCNQWELPIFNSTLVYLNQVLRKKAPVRDEDYQAVTKAFKDFYSNCITGAGAKEPSCQSAATSGVVNWSFSFVSSSAANATPGNSRCAVNLMIATQFCR